MRKEPIYTFTANDRANIVAALRDAATAYAAYWDTLRQIENRQGIEIEPHQNLIGYLAAEIDAPASINGLELRPDYVWEYFEQQTKLRL